jgi:hypothetical protein
LKFIGEYSELISKRIKFITIEMGMMIKGAFDLEKTSNL